MIQSHRISHSLTFINKVLCSRVGQNCDILRNFMRKQQFFYKSLHHTKKAGTSNQFAIKTLSMLQMSYICFVCVCVSMSFDTDIAG